MTAGSRLGVPTATYDREVEERPVERGRESRRVPRGRPGGLGSPATSSPSGTIQFFMDVTAKLDIDRGAKEIVLRWPCQTRVVRLSPALARRLAVTLVQYADALTRPRPNGDAILGNGGPSPDHDREHDDGG